MDSVVELYLRGTWSPVGILSVDGQAGSFEYSAEYVFGPTPEPLCARLPVRMDQVRIEPGARNSDLAYLWDLVPQGKGRRHLVELLETADNEENDLFLAQHGAFAPIGRARLSTAVDFYQAQTRGDVADGFEFRDIIERTDNFLEQLSLHSMLAAGTPGVQGVAPKFLLTESHSGLWFPDVALEDRQARQHWIVKLPRGNQASDEKILRHEAIYLQAAAACGLRVVEGARYENGMLFLPRFDRKVEAGGVQRIHQESLASLTGAVGFARNASLFDLTRAIAAKASTPEIEVSEFLCRDVLNRALRNTDNHLRNTSIQCLPDGTWQLSPLYDLAPMYLDAELITRTANWITPDREIVQDWRQILDLLALSPNVQAAAKVSLQKLAKEYLPRVPETLKGLQTDNDVLATCEQAIAAQIEALGSLDHDSH